jgi:hypothetical protein
MGIEQWKSLAPKKQNKISEESAREQLSRLMAYYETDLDDAAPEQEAAINQIMGRIMSAFMQGKIELSEDRESGELSIIQHIKKKDGKDTITYRPLKGNDKVKLENAGNDPTARMHYLMGILSGYGQDAIGKLSAGDLRVTEALAGFFIVLA